MCSCELLQQSPAARPRCGGRAVEVKGRGRCRARRRPSARPALAVERRATCAASDGFAADGSSVWRYPAWRGRATGGRAAFGSRLGRRLGRRGGAALTWRVWLCGLGRFALTATFRAGFLAAFDLTGLATLAVTLARSPVEATALAFLRPPCRPTRPMHPRRLRRARPAGRALDGALSSGSRSLARRRLYGSCGFPFGHWGILRYASMCSNRP